jgi:hypothetical protein
VKNDNPMTLKEKENSEKEKRKKKATLLFTIPLMKGPQGGLSYVQDLAKTINCSPSQR